MKAKRKPSFDAMIFLAKAAVGRTIESYQKKQTVFAQGDRADSLFYIQEGKVKLTVISTQGKEAVLSLLGAGKFFGEGCLVGQHLRMATASALSPCSLMKLEKAAVVQVLHDEPAFSELFVTHL